MSEQIEGRNPVLEALRSGHEINKLFVSKGERPGTLQNIIDLAQRKNIPVSFVENLVLDKMATTRNHQGVIAHAASYQYATVEAILQRAARKNEPPLVLMLDGVEDPQNLGSIIRTAEAAGVHGIILPQRRSVGLSTAVSRASAGAIEYVPVARVTNLTRTIEELKTAGLWFSGADVNGAIRFHEADLKGPLGLVMGGEGKGLSRLVAQHCDQLIRLPMWGQLNSLNVAVATGIILYEIRRQRVMGFQ
ncbi:MAG TPA: 23S rRNA (guanosine(2251)-2'-O)-methyltransferase RlmB [Bacillota bacterium]